ncbi:1,4-alpha-glucan branching enzyme [Desulfosalsimonas propionicica]|uniref:1,4-alpha-glucan branching enzyme n=1 Tax=Desulfosalsimonas propionicica TaxID=332175 RepID=A0A7W0C719_9BACT|nr:glycogen-binding domain-containing protein [Desulfosalsimonas propionicica]MBA2880328.1 1,4-alpha-glucan branching enzyme [Desulfosalsimonas propionicica]
MDKTNKGRRRVTFRLAAPDAAEVSLGGSFNNWNNRKHLMKKKPGGFWEKIVMLPPGRYEYKFMIDGKWCLDPANRQSCDNSFGTRNSVIEVSAPPISLRARKK